MKQADVRWQVAGTRDVGVLVSDTMMFERADPHPSDQYLGSFYGLAMPLVMRGIPVDPVQIESATAPGFLSRYQVCCSSLTKAKSRQRRSFMPRWPTWVRDGGALVVVDNDDDPYNAVREWWNTAPNSYTTPREHLFAQLHIPIDGAGLFHVGRGMVLSERVSPAALTYQPDGGDTLRGYARQAAAAVHLRWSETNALVLRRGPYIVAAGLDEPVPGATPVMLHGHFVDLFDADLPVLTTVTLTPGTRDLLFDLDYKRTASAMPRVVAAACQVRDVHATARRLTFAAEGLADTNAVVRIQSRLKPTSVSIAGKILLSMRLSNSRTARSCSASPTPSIRSPSRSASDACSD